jgi:acyl carrier protein phosphodiesterase
MNFLTHLFFANESSEQTKGLITGNATKASDLATYNLEVLKGIAIDMQIGLWAENHPAFQRSLQRLNFKFGEKQATFIINVFYDHMLAKDWQKYSKQSLEEFSERIYEIILINRYSFPYRVRKFAPEMIAKKWITSMRNIEGTHQYIKMLSKNERTINIDQCLFELIENYQHYQKDFEEYFSSLIEFMIDEVRKCNSIKHEKEFFLLSA